MSDLRVFNDRRVCDKCDKIFLLATETTDFIEGKPNPYINEEMVEGVYCFDCIEEMETDIETLIDHLVDKSTDFEYWVDEEGETDTELSLSSDGFLRLSDKLEELFESFGLTREKSEDEFAFIRENLIDSFNKQANEEERLMSGLEASVWEQLEELIYENCNKNTLNFEEYETRHGVDLLRENLDIKGILKCITLLNKEIYDE